MCQHLLVLVERGERRFVGQCDHGTIHLAWGLAILDLGCDDFKQLSEQLTLCLEQNDFESMCRGRFRMFCTAHHSFQLWIGAVGLYFTQTELFLFADMLEDTRGKLANTTPCSHPAHLTSEFQVMRVRNNNSFASN